MTNKLYLFQETLTNYILRAQFGFEKDLIIRSDNTYKKSNKTIRFGKYHNMIIEPQIAIRGHFQSALQESMKYAMQNGANILAYSCAESDFLEDNGFQKGVHYKSHILMPGNISDIIKKLEII